MTSKPSWDVFIAHAGADLPDAERIYDLLAARFRVFLDARSLLPGDNWPQVIERAQQESRVTVVLVSSRTKDAYYQQDEIVQAVELSRADDHRVIPVFLEGRQVQYNVYGLRSKHGLYIENGDLSAVAERIATLLASGDDASRGHDREGLDPRPLVATDFLCIPRIINPPDGERPQQCTVWLSAAGSDIYTVDSITIEHLKGGLLSGMTGVVLVDAQYSFHFRANSRETSPLNPALRLDPRDRREVFFTLGLAPDGVFPSSGGTVRASIHYHTSRGRQGTLKLEQPSPAAKALAKLLAADVATYEMIVMPTGVQRGFEPDEPQPQYHYHPLYFTSTYLPDPLPDPPPRITLDTNRLTVNAAIVNGGLVPRLIEQVAEGDRLSFDLLAGIPDRRGSESLVSLLDSGLHADEAIEALCLRHMITPDALLAETVVPLSARLPLGRQNEYRSNEYMVASLVWHPVGQWVAALLSRQLRHKGLAGLYLRREGLTPTEASAVEDAALQNLKEPYPKKEAVQFLLWRHHSPQDLIAQLSTSGDTEIPGAAYKKALIQSLLSTTT